MKELFYNDMWSKNKKVSLLINILLFLISINFMHIGQLFLPIVCVVLFIDSKYVIKIKNKFVFFLLCLFAISFFIFSYKQGFYSTMGFCVPMAYYIGSNLKNDNESNIVKLIYIISFGLALHMILNMLMEALVFWPGKILFMFNKPRHYDIWLFVISKIIKVEASFSLIKTTGMAMNYLLICSIIVYLIKYEKNVPIKIVGFFIYLLSSVYCMALGRRTSFFVLVLVFICNLLLDLHNKNIKQYSKKYVLLFILFLIIVVYIVNIANTKSLINNISILKRLSEKGIKSDRLSIFIEYIKLMPYHIWGRQEISGLIGLQIHDLWGDVYDYAGIVPYVVLIVYSIQLVKVNIKNKSKSKYSIEIRNMLFIIFIVFAMQMFVEPVFTSSSIIFICFVIIESAIRIE